MAQSLTEIIENILTQQSQLTERVNTHTDELVMVYKRTVELTSKLNEVINRIEKQKENKDGSKK